MENLTLAQIKETCSPKQIEMAIQSLMHAIDDKEELVKLTVCRHYNTNVEDVISKCRKRELCEPRQIIHYILNRFYQRTQEYIGAMFRFDHSLVSYSINSVENHYLTERDFRLRLLKIFKDLNIPPNFLEQDRAN